MFYIKLKTINIHLYNDIHIHIHTYNMAPLFHSIKQIASHQGEEPEIIKGCQQ